MSQGFSKKKKLEPFSGDALCEKILCFVETFAMRPKMVHVAFFLLF